MHAITIALALVSAAATQQAPAQKSYGQGQEVRICGEVKTQRTAPPVCDTTMRVVSGGEEFEIVIPASVGKDFPLAPQRMRGVEACFTGRIALAPGVVKLNVSSASGIEVKTTAPDSAFGADAALPCEANVTMPRVLKETKPRYTVNAMRERAQGTVEVEAIVDIDGTVRDARVIRHLHPELDDSALASIREWRFVPGMLNTKPVPVLVEIELTFTRR